MKKFLLFLLSIAMLFFSCSNISHDDGSGDRDSADGATYLVIRSTSVNRTVVPSEEDAGLGALSNLVLKGTRIADSESVSTEETVQTLATAENYEKLTEKKIEIQTGYWSFTLSADLNGIPFSDTVTKLIEAGKENEISFNLSVEEGFGGGLAITLNFTDASANVTSAKATLTAMDEGSSFEGDIKSYTRVKGDFEFKEDENGEMSASIRFVHAITDDSSRIPDGTYKLVFDFYVDGHDENDTIKLEPIPYIVRIADGITTTYTDKIKLNETYTITYKLADDDDSPATLADGEVQVTKYSHKSGEIKLPKMKRAGYVFGGWYVKYGVGGDFKRFIETIPTDSSNGVTVYAQWYDPNLYVGNNALNITLACEDETNTVISDALAKEIPLLPLNQNIVLTATDSDGNAVSDVAFTASILYHGNTIPTGYTLEDGVLNVSTTMPKVTSDACQLYVTATKGTVTSSQTFEVKFGGFYTGSASELGSFDMLASGASTTIPLYISITGTGDLATVAGSLSGKSNKIYLDLSGMTDVTAVGAEVFDSCSGIVSLVLPEGTTTIVSNALQGLSNLEEITLPETVSVIEDGAFPAYNKINKITLAGENKTFAITDDGAILLDNSGTIVLVAQASGITTLDFSESPLSAVTEIPAYAFLGVESLTTVSDFGNVTDIGDGGFYGAGLTGNLDLSKITSIGSMAFAGCKNLTCIMLNSNATVTIARQAFYGAGLTELYLPATTDFTPTEVDDSDPEHIRYTYNQAFYTCKSLKTVKIAADFSRELNASMFERCSNLENFVIDGTSEWYSTACDGALLIQSGSYLICAAQGGIPATIDFSSSELSGITNIERAAFAGDENLEEEERTSFAVANFGSVTTIVEEAFKASGITSVADFGLVCDIGDYAFSYTPLASIPAITEDMKVGSFAFSDTKLAEVTIASPQITINGSAFERSPIEKVTLDFEIDYNDTTDYSGYIPEGYNNLSYLCSQEYFINRYILSSWCGFKGVKELVLNKKVTLRDYSYDSEDERTVEMTVGNEEKTYHVERPFETFMESLEKLTFKGAGSSSVGAYQFHGFSKLETVTFETPSGWKWTGTSNGTTTDIDVSSPETNATNLKSETGAWYNYTLNLIEE